MVSDAQACEANDVRDPAKQKRLPVDGLSPQLLFGLKPIGIIFSVDQVSAAEPPAKPSSIAMRTTLCLLTNPLP